MAIKRCVQASDKLHQKSLDGTGYWGTQGAGCIVYARTTGRFLLMLRSTEVEQPLTWGTIGGAIDPKENPVKAVRRELLEEAGYKGKIDLQPLYIYRDKSFRYFNFLATVDKEFKPICDWENIRGQWFEFGMWPRPLHFGLKKLFKDKASMDILWSVVPKRGV